jgi:hypothetical protein
MSCFRSRRTTELYPDQCGAFNLTACYRRLIAMFSEPRLQVLPLLMIPQSWLRSCAIDTVPFNFARYLL